MSAAAPQTTSPAAAEKAREAAERENENNENNENEEARWRPVLGLPCQLTVELPLPNFKVADFLALRPGSVLATNWRLAHDIPLRINGTLIGWAEFEGAGSRLAVRLTELA
ncbi:MAG TPA: FliM/FliN family flagellar motor C-terminal domain-containing protein [Candidatus Sulfotelmatobacter sp.]|nr:FliM/FliN family flagellar motor C-terminal domain-containing protein [Candidatus Sulfotelmatobacter sp.]